MRLLSEVVSRLRSWLGRVREERELAEEIRFHIESETERIRRSGVDAKEARRIAHVRFGGVERMRQRTREARGTVWLETLLTDLRLAHRGLVRTPGQTLAAIVTLGLGIGVATTMFGTIYGAFYRGLPWDDPETFVWIEQTNAWGDGGPVPLHDFVQWRDASRSFRDLGGHYWRTVGLRTSSGTVQVAAAAVTWNTFAIVGTEPSMGRGFAPADDLPGAPLVLVISQRLWEDRFGADPGTIGREVAVNGEPATIVGVMPDGFHFPEIQDAWMPIREDPDLLLRGAGPTLTVFGHLADGVTIEEAEAEVAMLARQTAREHPETNEGLGATVNDFVEQTGQGPAILINWMLMLAALAVLLIACANVANLLLARAARRVREVALRSALGARRSQIIVHMLAESGAIGLYGAVVGAAVGWLGLGSIRGAMSQVAGTPYWIRFDFDLPVFLFAVAAAGGAGIVAGLIPAVRASRGDLADVLKDGTRGSTGLRVGRLSRALVGVEVALSACLLVVSGLMVKSVVTLARVELPFVSERVLVASVDLFDDSEGSAASRDGAFARLLARTVELPGAEAAALASRAPGLPTPEVPWEAEGRPYTRDRELPRARTATVSAEYFALLGIGPIAGRTFTELDGEAGMPVAIVNRSFAETHFGEQDPVGRRVRARAPQDGVEGDWRLVVGVVPDLMMQGLDLVGSVRGDGVYVPAIEGAGLPSTLLVRTRGTPLEVVDDLRGLARSVHPDLSIYDALTMPRTLERVTWYFVLTARVFVAFGAVALFLAFVGLLGVVATEAERRTQEVGVRMALGARAADVVRLIVGQSVGRISLGITVGLLMATGLARAMAVALYQTSPADPVVYAAAVLFIVLVSAAASLFPATRAARTDPVRSLQAR